MKAQKADRDAAGKIEREPELDDADERALDHIWDSLGREASNRPSPAPTPAPKSRGRRS